MERVLFLHPSDEQYGADRVLRTAAVGMRARGHDVRVLLADDSAPGWLSSQLAADGIEVRRGPLAPARRRYLHPAGLPGYVAALWRARRWIRREAEALDATVIHVNTSALLAVALIRRRGGPRLIWHVHEIVVSPRPLAWLFRAIPVRRSDRVIAISRAVADHLGPAPAGRIIVLYNGVEASDSAEQEVDLPGRRPRVGFIGRLNRWKGYEVFVEAATILAQRHSETDFVLIGSAPPGEEGRLLDLRAGIERAGLGGRIFAIGHHPLADRAYGGLDVVAVPSTWPEPFGLVIVEAMRAGVAVVATRHGAAPELIDDGVTGLLVPPGDAAALADAIAALLDDPRRRRRLATAARVAARERFTVARFLDGLEAIYAGEGGPP
jgi:glycosyltransferase involved in cell wall biosynthesis